MSSTVTNLDRIYNESFQYSLPRNILEGFLSGNAFDNTVPYTEEESKKLCNDIASLYSGIWTSWPVKEKLAVITAGAPGAGKTVKLWQDLRANGTCEGLNYAYICPDDVCLKGMTRTYQADIEGIDSSNDARLKAYNKWRPGSNAAAHLILGNLIRENYAFYFGSTSSGPATGKFFEFLKAQGYTIRLIHVSAPDQVRWDSIKERDKTFVQTTEQDVKEKGLLLPQRINDTFLKYADVIEFYYRGDVKAHALIAAKWLRNADPSQYLGTLEIQNPEKYAQIKTIHDEAVKVLNKPELYWKDAVESKSKVTKVN